MAQSGMLDPPSSPWPRPCLRDEENPAAMIVLNVSVVYLPATSDLILDFVPCHNFMPLCAPCPSPRGVVDVCTVCGGENGQI